MPLLRPGTRQGGHLCHFHSTPYWRNFCAANDIIKKAKRQPTEGKK